jgi:hypothetical protein
VQALAADDQDGVPPFDTPPTDLDRMSIKGRLAFADDPVAMPKTHKEAKTPSDCPRRTLCAEPDDGAGVCGS